MLTLRPYQQDLYEKARAEFLAGNHRVLVVAPCGAGKTAVAAAMMQATLRNNPHSTCLLLVHRIELLNQHIATLAEYGVDTSRIRIESVFTEARRLGQYEKPALLVLDEAHLSKAASWEKVVQYYDTWTVGFSATPRRLDNRPLGDIFQAMVQGITHKELEAQGCLAPFDYYAPTELDLSGVTKRAGDFAGDEVEDLVCTRTVYGDVLKSYLQFAEGKRAIAFCVSVRHSREVAELFNNAGIPAASLDGSMSASSRANIMQGFRDGSIQILSSCNIISEGISVDECECCLLLRPTDSLALYIQQSCRCLRFMEDKRAVILDFCGNYSRHGLPDTDREWSLDAAAPKRAEFNPDGSLALRVCGFCFKTFETASACPFCGEQYKLKPREIKQMKEVELARINKEQFEKEQARKAEAAQDIRNARCYEDLLRIEKKYGYKRGWAMVRARLRGYR